MPPEIKKIYIYYTEFNSTKLKSKLLGYIFLFFPMEFVKRHGRKDRNKTTSVELPGEF